MRRRLIFVVLALLLPPAAPRPAAAVVPLLDERALPPLPVEALEDRWEPRTAVVAASEVRLGAVGVHTHANWVLFRLPFDSRERARIRHVHVEASASGPTDVGALRVGSICTRVPGFGSLANWSLFTVGGTGNTGRFGGHPARPTDDPRVVAVNVPTRVANYVACGMDDAHLESPAAWSLRIRWEERPRRPRGPGLAEPPGKGEN